MPFTTLPGSKEHVELVKSAGAANSIIILYIPRLFARSTAGARSSSHFTVNPPDVSFLLGNSSPPPLEGCPDHQHNPTQANPDLTSPLSLPRSAQRRHRALGEGDLAHHTTAAPLISLLGLRVAMASLIPLINDLLPMIVSSPVFVTKANTLGAPDATLQPGPANEANAVVSKSDKLCASGKSSSAHRVFPPASA